MTDIIESIPRRWLSAGAILWAVFLGLCVAGGLLLCLWLVSVWAARPANAEDGYGYRWVTQRVAHRSCDWADYCATYYIYRRVRVREYQPQVYSYVRRGRDEDYRDRRDHDTGGQCREVLDVLSTEHQSEDNARESARKLVMAKIQWLYGSQYMDLANAADVRWRCSASNAHDTVSGRLTEGAAKLIGRDGQNVRCALWVKPCKAPREKDKETRR